MSRAKIALLVLAVVAAAAVVASALRGAGRGGPPPAPPAQRSPAGAREAEEALLNERSFSHPVRNVPAPDVELMRADGSRVRLSSLRGKVLFVNFWATWCPPCIQEMPSMLRLGRELAAAHPGAFEMVAVSGDDGWEPVNDYFAKNFGGVPRGFTVVRDPDAAAARAFYCAARGYCPDVKFPETYVVDRSGRIVAMMVGPRDWSDPAARQLLEFLVRG
jgi:thiol-disulfide isomerase/thioredoxin